MPVEDTAASTTAEQTEFAESEPESTNSAESSASDAAPESSPEEQFYAESPEPPETEEQDDESVSASEAAKRPEKESKAERRIKQLTAQVKSLQQKAAHSPQQPGESEPPAEPVEPDIDDYDTVEDYRAALRKWNADSQQYALKKAERDKAEAARRAEEQKRESELRARWGKGEARVKAINPDFSHQQVLDVVQPNPTLNGFLGYSDYGAEIANYLLENPEEAEAIRKLDPYATMRRIIPLETRFANQDKGIKPKPTGTVSTTVRGKAGAPAREKDLADFFYN